MKTERGQIVANTSTNTLVVTDVESAVNRIASMIRQLDIRTPQVAIQAKIIFISRTLVEGLGVRYEIKDLRGNQLNRFLPGVRIAGGQQEEVPQGTPVVLFGGSSVAAAGNAEAVVSSPTLEVLASFVAGRFNIFAFIQALQRTELADVQAHPLVTTLDNQQARILVGQRTPIRVVDLGAIGAPGGQAPRATAQLVETGIKLEVTPHITADRRILLQLQAENSDARPVAGEFGVVFDTQEGRTRLLVDDGETAVIGGLTVTRISETRQGIPLLMDIPILGALFRTTSRQEIKQDLLILVTPRIVES
jgi:type IV pilus assembly protein PilQ